MHPKLDPDTDNLIAFNQLVIAAAEEVTAKAARERQRLRAAIEESRELRERWRAESRDQAERLSR